MILSFGDDATKDIYDGIDSKAARTIPQNIWNTAVRKLDAINAASDLRDLNIPPGNRLEKLKGELAEFHSIRVNDQYRIIFIWDEGNAGNVRVVDYH